MHVLFHVLARYGEADLAYEMQMRSEYPSYTYWVSGGETAMPEHFALENQASSHNHHFMGDVARFYIAWIAGLHIKSPTEVELHPRFVGGLTEAESYYELPLGRVSVSWKKDGDVYRVKAKIPAGVSYTADLPDGAELEIL
jgi:alpha-L-rhamnosidase